ncbi:MAG: Asp-tRNA(Asn)/Glu-tRNA(Gln) amidotransferase subunit GatC [Clostridia bacterium]|nr:Asp-tRNA(Asn)/Glu-tRNA(Gln) amidotransferase subunit GatC [Clostridia bacterium]
MKVDIEYLEKLSKLKIDDEKKEKFEQDFEKILAFVDDITKLELPEEDKSRAVALSQLREDEFTQKDKVDVLSCAPKKKDGCYLTPLVVE